MLGCPCGCVNVEKEKALPFNVEKSKSEVYWAAPVGTSTLDKGQGYACQF